MTVQARRSNMADRGTWQGVEQFNVCPLFLNSPTLYPITGRKPPPPDLPSLLFDQRIVYLGMPVSSGSPGPTCVQNWPKAMRTTSCASD